MDANIWWPWRSEKIEVHTNPWQKSTQSFNIAYCETAAVRTKRLIIVGNRGRVYTKKAQLMAK